MPTRITGIMLAASLLACSSGTIEHATDHDEGELTALAFDPKRVATVTGEVLDIEAYQHIERSRAGVRISVKSGSDTYYVYLAPAK